ncbi:MAG: peptide-binding protein [Desulfuromonadales bacterium]|nr:peptide-binding protein [Desulfuromonadales bacterium]
MRFLFLGVFFLLCACEQRDVSVVATGEAAKPTPGDTIVEASIGEPSNLLPVIASDSSSSDINSRVYSGLVRYDKNLELEGELAESWEISEDSLSITFHLRKDVKWHDGAPFTSSDVLFTYQMYIDPKVPTSYAEAYLQVLHAEAPDDYTFRVTYAQPYAPALESWGIPIHPKHLLEGRDVTKSELTRHPIGTGPFRFVKWDSGVKVVLEAYDDYFEGRPYINRVLYRIIPDLSTQFLELLSGGVDYMGLTPIQYSTQTNTPAFKRNSNKYNYLSFTYTYLGFNLEKPLFQDQRVRQAISFAIDKQELIDGVLLGLGQVATGPYKPDLWTYNPNVKRYDYDVNQAKKLLADAGWSDSDKDGVLDKSGKPFSFTIVTNQGNDVRSKSAEIIQRRLKEVGIAVDIRVVEWATFLKEFINAGNFDATILGWSGGPEPDQYDIWHSSKTGPRELNFIHYRNDEVDQLLEQGRRTFDRDERKRIYDRFQEILAEEQPYTFLYVAESLPAVAKRFRGIEKAPAGIGYNFIEWYVPKSEQKYAR